MTPDEEPEEPLDLAAVRRALRTLGMRPSRSADQAFEREVAELRAMSARERMELALRLGQRDREFRRRAGNLPRK